MSQRLRLGVIGLGAMGTDLVRFAARHRDVEVVMAADPSTDARSRFAAAWPGVRVVARGTVVIDSDVDVVYIAAPPNAHADLAIAALESGKHVFCEKPLAISLADGDRIREAVRASGQVFAVNYSFSDRAPVLEIERAVRAGEAGDIRRIDVELSFPEWPRAFQRDASWLARTEQGGFVREVFSHFAYLTDRILGPIELTEAQVVNGSGARASETSVHARMTSAARVPVRLVADAHVALPETYTWTLVGTHRSYRLLDWERLEVCDPGGPWRSVTPAGPLGSEATRLTSFAAAVRGGTPTGLADVDAAWRVQRVVESILATAAR